MVPQEKAEGMSEDMKPLLRGICSFICPTSIFWVVTMWHVLCWDLRTQINQTYWKHLGESDIWRKVSPWRQEPLSYVEERAMAQSQRQSPETLSPILSTPHCLRLHRVFHSELIRELAHHPEISEDLWRDIQEKISPIQTRIPSLPLTHHISLSL